MLAIFDISSVNISRYNSELLNSYSEQYIAYVDDPEMCVGTKSSKEEVLVLSGGWSIRKIMHSFKNYGVSIIIISGQRPADFRFIIAANSLGIPIVYKMHGLYVEHVKRHIVFYFSNIKKTLRTIAYLYDISLFTKSIATSKGILLSFIFGDNRKSWMNLENLRVDYALAWSEYWISWHELHWGMNPRHGWRVIGNPDSVKFRTNKVEVHGLCYIYQTLVEDGRISKSTMESFYDNLAEIAHKKKTVVNVKWHIRGDTSIRTSLERRGFRIYDAFPIGRIYVGHYSSLLGLIPVVGGSLFVFELKGHKTPTPIAKCATLVTDNIETLAKGMTLAHTVDINKLNNAIYYFGDRYSQNIENLIISQYVVDKWQCLDCAK
jgi:hypothetical protein